EKWAAFGWNVIELADGNDPYAVKDAVEQAKKNRGSGKPTMIILNTTKGCGVSFVEAMHEKNHHVDLSKEDMQRALEEIKGGAN
ncbi:MAG: transketolase, partial [Oscillospiraceae bacterium]|nr:transketolase [Oscillospiraceae bacterium]